MKEFASHFWWITVDLFYFLLYFMDELLFIYGFVLRKLQKVTQEKFSARINPNSSSIIKFINLNSTAWSHIAKKVLEPQNCDTNYFLPSFGDTKTFFIAVCWSSSDKKSCKCEFDLCWVISEPRQSAIENQLVFNGQKNMLDCLRATNFTYSHIFSSIVKFQGRSLWLDFHERNRIYWHQVQGRLSR